MAEKRLNIELSENDYVLVKEAAVAEGVIVTASARGAILWAALPAEPENPALSPGFPPGWSRCWFFCALPPKWKPDKGLNSGLSEGREVDLGTTPNAAY